MNSKHTHFIVAGLLATLGLAASAQSPTPAAPSAPAASALREADGRHGDPAFRQARMAQRQADLKQKLQITAAQERAWSSFTTAMKPTGAMQRLDHDALARLATPDRIDQMRAQRTARIAEMDRRGDATKAFYATLTADQKKVFDAETVRHGHRGHHGGLKG